MPPVGIRTPLEDRLVQLFKEISPHNIAIRTQCSLAIARHILENVRDKVVQHRDELLRNTPDQLTDEAVYRVVETAAMDHIDIPTLAQKRRTTDDVVSRALISVLNETRKLQNARKSNVPSTSGASTQLLQLGRLDWPESIPEHSAMLKHAFDVINKDDTRSQQVLESLRFGATLLDDKIKELYNKLPDLARTEDVDARNKVTASKHPATTVGGSGVTGKERKRPSPIVTAAVPSLRRTPHLKVVENTAQPIFPLANAQTSAYPSGCPSQQSYIPGANLQPVRLPNSSQTPANPYMSLPPLSAAIRSIIPPFVSPYAPIQPPDAAVTHKQPNQPDAEHQLDFKHGLLRSPGNSPKKKKARQHKVGRGSSPSKTVSKKLKGAINAWTIFTTVERKRRPLEVFAQMTLSDIWSRMSDKEKAPYYAAADSTKEHYRRQLDALSHTDGEDKQPSNDFWQQHDQWWKAFWDNVHAIPSAGSEARSSNVPQIINLTNDNGQRPDITEPRDARTTHALLRVLPQPSNLNPLRRVPAIANFRPLARRSVSSPVPSEAPADERARGIPERLQERNAGLNAALASAPPPQQMAPIPPPLRLTDGRRHSSGWNSMNVGTNAGEADQGSKENWDLYAPPTPPRRK